MANTKWHHLYRGKAWKELRIRCFTRDNYKCQMCGKLCHGTGRDNPNTPVADHILPHKGNEELFFKLSNLQTLHQSPCHNKHKQAQEAGRYLSPIGEDGWPTDETHLANRKYDA